MGIISRRWRWLKRFRHRRGYGVHSPFAFQFLTYVVYEKGTYYAYDDLKKQHFCAAYLWNGHEVKCRKFLFRLANFVHPRQIQIYGRLTNAQIDYIAAGCRSAQMQYMTQKKLTENLSDTGKQETLLTIIGPDIPTEQWLTVAASLPAGDSMCVIMGIHATRRARATWRRLQQHPSVFVSFDLYDFGVLCYDTTKQRQHYIVNF